jgi:hypothetical protein
VLVVTNEKVFVFNNFIFEVFIVKWCNCYNDHHPFFIMLQVSWISFFHCLFLSFSFIRRKFVIYNQFCNLKM